LETSLSSQSLGYGTDKGKEWGDGERKEGEGREVKGPQVTVEPSEPCYATVYINLGEEVSEWANEQLSQREIQRLCVERMYVHQPW